MATTFENETKRKLTGIATVGEAGASYTVYEKNWICSQCKYENYASKFKCTRCRARKPEGTEHVVEDSLQKKGHAWKETIDPVTQQLYYYHTETGETRWDRPQEMGHAPMASGWFGRGSASGVNRITGEDYNERNTRHLQRPARKQKEYIEANRTVLEGANEYNIWYGKYLGDHWREGKGREPAETRCDVERDAGWTKADKIDSKSKFFCIHFARGMCARGLECQYFHRIPTLKDDAIAGQLHDCFGRERHANHRDDMDGVGSFTNPSRTLYVGGIQKSTYRSQEELETALWRHFGEFGEVEHINFIPRLSIAFIRFRLRTNCEFAKEAMSNQALDGSENLNIKWAYDDPNPVAQESIKRANLDAAMALVQAQGVSLEAAPYDYPEDYHLPSAKRMKGGEEEEEEEEPALSYPNTDQQYETSAAAAAGTDNPLRTSGLVSSSSVEDDEEEETLGEWLPVWDSQYNAYYYMNTKTQAVTWTPPTATATDGKEGEDETNNEEQK